LPGDVDIQGMPQTKVALIDAHALIHRGYHALPPMSTSTGVPTNAVYGFTTMLLKTLKALKPTHVVAAFDVAAPTFRSQDFADYKAHRKAAPDDLKVQFDIVRRVVRAFNIPLLEAPGYEADDIIGTLVKTLGDSVQKIIVTGDMDALQLVDDTTTVFTLKRGIGDTILYTEAAVRERYGFDPKHVPEYKGLCGDPSDNIPGVAGIGDKTARELVSKYGTIEAIYDHFDELQDRLKKKLEGKKDEALFSRKLAQMHMSVPLEFNLEAARLEDYDPRKVRELFIELEFNSLLQRLPDSDQPLQPTLFETAVVNAPTEMPKHYHLVQTKTAAKALRSALKKAKLIGFDTETDYLNARTASIVGMSFAVKQGKKFEAWYVPVTPKSVKEWQDILEDPAIKKVGHNLKYDIKVLAQSDIALAGVAFDSMLASYLLQPGVRQHNLDALAIRELGHRPIPITDLIGTGKKQKRMSEVDLTALAVYAAEDAELALKLSELLQQKIKDEGLSRVLEELELPLIEVLAHMELTGVRLDQAVLKKLETTVSRRLLNLEQKIWKEAGEEFNINSTRQLRVVLYEKLKLNIVGIARTQTGYSTAASELNKLRGQHPIIEHLEEYRELSKLLNTYIIALPALIDKDTGRVYTSFNQVVAATGRLSSSDPGLQNIPVRTELGESVRAAFIADKGNVLVKADYSQLELRLAAHIAQDEKMLAAFRAGEDIHRATAAWVYGIKPAEVTPEQRRVAKTLNFGVLYGMGPRNFARASKLSVQEAHEFIDRYRAQYTGITRLMVETIQSARGLGYVETLFGRKRYLPEINSSSPMVRSQAERMAFNFPMQGTEADIIKKAMIELYGVLKEEFPKSALVLTVHDELVVEAPEKDATTIAQRMKKVMEGIMTLDVPLDVEVAIGKNWRDTEPV
jgi:DNA polymerase-1